MIKNDKPKRILVVDDDQTIRAFLRDYLESLGHQVESANDGFEAIAKLELDIDLVFLDVRMPGMDGFEVTRWIRDNSQFKDIPVIMATGLNTTQDRIRAVEAGANDFITKPFDCTEIYTRTTSLLRMKEAHDALKSYKNELEGTVAKRTEALRRALDKMVDTQRRLREANLETIHRLVIAAEFKDMNTAAHIQRMSRFSAMLARKINLTPGEVESILYASPMHDIGKIGTPEEILLKPGKLSGDEWLEMKQHTLFGAQILENSSSELLHMGEIIAVSHHERWDGGGYPHGLAGEEIPLWGRICTIADVFDALASERPYKKAFSNEEALKILKEGSGKQFDRQLVNIFTDNMSEVIEIQNKISRFGNDK